MIFFEIPGIEPRFLSCRGLAEGLRLSRTVLGMVDVREVERLESARTLSRKRAS